MILDVEKYLDAGYLRFVEGGYVLDPKAPAEVQKALFSLNNEYNDIFGESIIFFKERPKDGLTEDIVMDDRWITIGHRDADGDDEGRKGRHILLKEGEDPKEALERTIKKDLDKDGKVGKKEDTEKKEEKTEPKEEPKKEPKKEDKPEPKPETKPESKEEPKQEKKEPVSEKTPALEYADLLDKENSEGLTDAEKARKKELEEKEGFGEKSGYKDLSDEELEDKLDNALHERGKILNEIDIAVNNNPEYLKMREEADKLRAESNRLPFGSKERDEVSKKLYALQDKIRHQLEETYRSEREKRNEEYNKLSEPINAMKEEKDKRRKERLKRETEFRDLLDKKILDAMRDELSDEEKVAKFKEIDDIIEKSDFDHFLKDAYRGRIQEQESKASFNTHVNRVKEGLKNYSKKTESLVKDFESIVPPRDKYSSDLEKLDQSSKELRSQKGETPEKEEEIRTKIWQNIMTRSEIEEKISKENKERFEKISEVLRKNGKTNFKVTAGKSTIKGIYDRLNGVLGGVFGENIRTDNAPEVRALKGRAYYNPADNSFKVERNGDFGEVIHEYTHFLEARNPKMLTNSLAFLEYRTKGDKAQSMNSAYTDGRSFKASEVTKKDRFFTPYCGKIYSNSGEYRNAYASEIMSMGVQRLFTEPAKFAKEDREYFDFVVANMRGEL